MTKSLIFEDDCGCRQVLVDALSDYDIEVIAHDDPTCFLKDSDKCPEAKPCVDFILSDNLMPHMTGVEFFQRLAEMGCKIPARNRAILSGYLAGEDIEKIEKLGIKLFRKPCNLGNIFSWLEEIGAIAR